MRSIIMGSFGLFIGIMCIVLQVTGRWSGKVTSGWMVGILLIIFSVYRLGSGFKRL
jgi:hypothetical protein